MISARRIYYGMNVVNILLGLLIIGSVIIGSGLIQKQADKLAQAKVQNKVIEEQQVQLTQAKKDIETYKDLNSTARSIVPQDKDQAKTVREISKLAEESGITLKGIAFNSSSLGQAAVAQPAQNSDGSPKTTVQTPTLTQVKPVDGIPGVYALEITVSSLETAPIPYEKFISFLEKLESNRRTAHVDNLTVKPTDAGDSLSFTLTLSAYVKP